jgi:hypothetical protein
MLRAYLPNAVARQMVLQVAMQDIGQLTDIQQPPGTGKLQTLKRPVASGSQARAERVYLAPGMAPRTCSISSNSFFELEPRYGIEP